MLLLTDRWPNSAVTEFLDEEIHYLAAVFEKVVIVPTRPDGPVRLQLPVNVFVDYSLANRLTSFGPWKWPAPRKMVVAFRSLTPKRCGLGANRIKNWRDWLNVSWQRASLIGRSDFLSVSGWAKKRKRPDVVYTFWLTSSSVALKAAWPGVPIVSRVHGGDLYSEVHGWESIPFQADSVEAVSLLASVSDHGRMYLKRKFPTSTEKIVTRRLGIPDLGIPERSSREADQVAILSASSIIPVKRVDLILQVMQMLVSSGLRVKWTHLGDGPGRTALERALSVDTANSLRVELRGHVPLYEVRRELVSGRHDLFINLSLSEGAPVSLMEAQCVGMPVVATDVGGTSEVIFEAFNELVSSSASLIEICAAVRRAINRDSKECTWRREYWSAKYYAAANYTSWATEIREIARLSRV